MEQKAGIVGIDVAREDERCMPAGSPNAKCMISSTACGPRERSSCTCFSGSGCCKSV
jgi:hypothetical protein